MKLIEFICALHLGIFSFSLMAGGGETLKEKWNRYFQEKKRIETAGFICKSFDDLCQKKETTMDDFEKWKQECVVMLSLDSMKISKNERKQELKCEWTSGKKSYSVFARRFGES